MWKGLKKVSILGVTFYSQPTALIPPEASPHKMWLKCDTNISPRRLITHLLHQMVHHRTTLHGNGQWSATIARITTKTHTTILTTKRSSESCTIRNFLRVTLSTGRLGAGRNPNSTSSRTKFGSSSVKIRKGMSTNVLSKSNHTHGGAISKI